MRFSFDGGYWVLKSDGESESLLFFQYPLPSLSLTFLATTTPRCSSSGPGRRRCRPTPGAQVFFRPFTGDEHQQVRPPFGLPFLLCKTEHPDPNFLFVFGSDLITSVYACIMPSKLRLFCKYYGVGVFMFTPMPFTGSAPTCMCNW